jgi:hypothetical protein
MRGTTISAKHRLVAGASSLAVESASLICVIYSPGHITLCSSAAEYMDTVDATGRRFMNAAASDNVEPAQK